MRNARAVYRKLKEIKYRYLVVMYKQHFRPSPENCKFNHRYEFIGDDGQKHEIRLCLLHQEDNTFRTVMPHLIDVCTEVGQCNAFVPQYTKEQVKALFEEELKNQRLKERKYPEVCALEWVLEQSVPGIPPINWVVALWFRFKRWALKERLL